MSEEEQDISKGFWIFGIMLPDADGKIQGNSYSGYRGKIKVTLGKPKREYGTSGKHMMMFKTVLPTYIYEKLNGMNIERTREGIGRSETTTHRYVDMKKSITANSLEALTKRFDGIVQDFLFVIQDEQAPKEKLIFVNWKSDFRRDKESNQNGAKVGHAMSMSFHFFSGFYNGRSYFDIEHKPINAQSNSYECDVPNYTQIPWTQEREDFFNHIFANFETFKDKLDDFYATLTPKTIDSHMSKFKMLT